MFARRRITVDVGKAASRPLFWLAFLALLLAASSPAWCLTTFYVDPDWGGTQTGAASTPWGSLTGSAWTAINAALASNDVTVYFTARAKASDANFVSTTGIAINRTDMSTHRLTLDGMSQWNSNAA